MDEKPYYGDSCPIAACATALAISALSVIRVSGRGSIEMAANVFSRPLALTKTPGNTVVYGWILEPSTNGQTEGARQKIDEVLVSVYRAPASYTGEDGLDITCHGGSAAGTAVLNALFRVGFRKALPGEFSFRAFANGRIDLTAAEGVMEIVGAKSDKGRQNAIGRLCGTLEKEINSIKTLLVSVLSEMELLLDYSEIDGISGGGSGSTLIHTVAKAKERLTRLADSYKTQRLYQDGALVVIAGRPNAGKSSIFNLLLKEERSIVTEIPGTTRDWIEAWVSINGIPVRLADTAGLRESTDIVEKLGIERSKSLLEGAHLVLYVIDGCAGITQEDEQFIYDGDNKKNTIAIWNKSDIAPHGPKDDYIALCATTGDGLDTLTKKITSYFLSQKLNMDTETGGASLGTDRQKALIESAIENTNEVLAMSHNGLPLDLISPVLRAAVDNLGFITGEVSTADILETMFCKFCVGK
ncbi:tRNA modification GTPase MnmE [Spirochaetia bacterium]|nr:tRNA modification GTPase MnmE [Spirochaetia bacterium]